MLTQIIPGSLQEIPGKAATNWSWGVLPDDWDRDDPKKMQQDTEQANRTIEIRRQGRAGEVAADGRSGGHRTPADGDQVRGVGRRSVCRLKIFASFLSLHSPQ